MDPIHIIDSNDDVAEGEPTHGNNKRGSSNDPGIFQKDLFTLYSCEASVFSFII